WRAKAGMAAALSATPQLTTRARSKADGAAPQKAVARRTPARTALVRSIIPTMRSVLLNVSQGSAFFQPCVSIAVDSSEFYSIKLRYEASASISFADNARATCGIGAAAAW